MMMRLLGATAVMASCGATELPSGWDRLHEEHFSVPIWEASGVETGESIEAAPKMGLFLQKVVDYLALRYNTSFSIALAAACTRVMAPFLAARYLDLLITLVVARRAPVPIKCPHFNACS